jgi:hypothetical protein
LYLTFILMEKNLDFTWENLKAFQGFNKSSSAITSIFITYLYAIISFLFV